MAERLSSAEQEPKPKVLVQFHGFDHYELNLQAIPDILTNFRRLIAQTRGRCVFFAESGDSSRSWGREMTKLAKKEGFDRQIVRVFMGRELGYWPSENQISGRIQTISDSDLPIIIRKKSIPLDYLQIYFLFHGLNMLREEFDFELEFETHSPPVRKTIERYGQSALELKLAAVNHWEQEEFLQVLALYRQHNLIVLRPPEVR